MGEDALRAAVGLRHSEQKERDTSVTVDEPEAVSVGSLAPDVAEPEPPEKVVTRTMAKIYARQGMYDRAIEVVDQLIEAEPGDESLTAQREELVRAASGKPAGNVIPEASSTADVQAEEGNGRDIVPIESLAPAQPDTLT
jgi:pentatricopeptide repeat protein